MAVAYCVVYQNELFRSLIERLFANEHESPLFSWEEIHRASVPAEVRRHRADDFEWVVMADLEGNEFCVAQ